MLRTNRLAILGVKVGSIAANLASFASFLFFIAERTRSVPAISGASVNVILHLAVLTSIAYGILWAMIERLFGWDYGAGGGPSLPTGWSAVALSLSMTLPLFVIPFFYQLVSGVAVLLPQHWRAMFLVLLLGAASHLAVFGVSPQVPGLRQRLAPMKGDTLFSAGWFMEGIYGAAIIGLIALPYRLVVNPTEPMRQVLVGRVLLPWFVYFSSMTVFTALKYPASLRDPLWVQVRGIVAGLIAMLCLCGGMFL